MLKVDYSRNNDEKGVFHRAYMTEEGFKNFTEKIKDIREVYVDKVSDEYTEIRKKVIKAIKGVNKSLYPIDLFLDCLNLYRIREDSDEDWWIVGSFLLDNDIEDTSAVGMNRACIRFLGKGVEPYKKIEVEFRYKDDSDCIIRCKTFYCEEDAKRFIEGNKGEINVLKVEDINDGHYIRSAANGDYSPSNPWDAPGMSISDFI